MNTPLTEVDWSALPQPVDDGAASHLSGISLPPISLRSTHGETINLMRLNGTTVIYIYPMTGPPDGVLPDGWDELPGARGCTPQSCAFRDGYAGLRNAGAQRLFGLSTQSTSYQKEAAERLHLPFPLLSDESLSFANALRLPKFEVEGQTLLKRCTLICRAGRITKVFYPVFPPDQNPTDVVEWLKENPI